METINVQIPEQSLNHAKDLMQQEAQTRENPGEWQGKARRTPMSPRPSSPSERGQEGTDGKACLVQVNSLSLSLLFYAPSDQPRVCQ